jgi:uncharacterized DUF497 family protein
MEAPAWSAASTCAADIFAPFRELRPRIAPNCPRLWISRITPARAEAHVTLDERGLDFEDSVEVFGGLSLDLPDERRDYGEPRIMTAGLLRGRLVIVICTPRGDTRHIISMRKANEREKARYGQRLGES